MLLAGCVNLDAMSEEERAAYMQEQEDQQLVRAEKLAEAYDYYRSMRNACISGGGVVVQTFSNNDLKRGRVNRFDLLRAGCMSKDSLRNGY